MQIGATGGGKAVTARQGGEAVQVVRTHATDADFQPVATAVLELGRELAQRAHRELIAVRVRQHNGRGSLLQAT